MKSYKTFVLPKHLVDLFGKEWEGTYTIHILSATEYLACGEDLAAEYRGKAIQNKTVWDGQLPPLVLQEKVIRKSVTLNGKPITEELPSKIYEMVASVSVPLNILTLEEGRQLFRDPV